MYTLRAGATMLRFLGGRMGEASFHVHTSVWPVVPCTFQLLDLCVRLFIYRFPSALSRASVVRLLMRLVFGH